MEAFERQPEIRSKRKEVFYASISFQDLKDGNSEAWSQFYRESIRYIKPLIALMMGNNSDVDDIFHDFYFRVMENIQQYAGNAAFSTWVHAIAQNEVKMHKRKAQYRSHFYNGRLYAAQEFNCTSAIDDPIELPRVKLKIAEEILKVLDPKKARALELRLEGLKDEEIGTKEGTREETIRTRIFYAKRSINLIFGEAFRQDGWEGVYNELQYLNLLSFEERRQEPSRIKQIQQSQTREEIRKYLQSLVDALQQNGFKHIKRIPDLTPENIVHVMVPYGEDQKMIDGEAFIHCLMKNVDIKDVPKNKQRTTAENLDILKKFCKVDALDKEYFTQENVRADLQAAVDFLCSKGVTVGRGKNKRIVKTVENLTVHNLSLAEFTISSGKKMKGATYISRAGIALGIAKSDYEAKSKPLEILNKLKEIAGVRIIV